MLHFHISKHCALFSNSSLAAEPRLGGRCVPRFPLIMEGDTAAWPIPVVLFPRPVPDNLKAFFGIGQKWQGHLAPNF
jgi:hypothetical protein